MSLEQLTLKQLRALAAVYRAGQLSAAARDLNITQSAVSVLIKQIETVLQVPLFDRTTRRLVPTTACKNAIGPVERILDDLRMLDLSIRDMRDLNRGTVRLTATPATGMAVLPDAVRRFRALWPAIELVIDDCAPDQFLTNILEERAEFGIGVAPPGDAAFESEPLTEDRLCAVLPALHPLAALTEVPWQALADEPLILSRRDYGVRDIVDSTLHAATGRHPKVAAEVGFLSSATWMASTGMGICVLPERLARLFFNEMLVVLPLCSPTVQRPISLVRKRHRTLTPAAQRFVEVLTESLRRA
ncbi:LysR family transcriptional regulator [Pararhodobacter sp. CCB-MM2]|uniref:LysR family transcriptional regulator n=1 Tax=Pararhodobacter sp. CCB-MM2 TaxID=1786003 RepID=UPI00082CABC8|nr:LysR family transcriptional regulator [Pararhodobacter sp. CCB-MM2]